MKRPVIGITCNFMENLSGTVEAGIAVPGQSWHLLAHDYIRAVQEVSGIPVLLPCQGSWEESRQLMDCLDGILISGGNDVYPGHYGERFDCRCGLLDPKRDSYEISAVREALERDLPLLGICRGIQVFNVACGGTLYQDLSGEACLPHNLWCGKRNLGTHYVDFPEASPLIEILGSERVWVNSFHHQAVRSLAPGVKVAAQGEDGVIEGVYMPGKRFALAVQWHPEMMFENDKQMSIFRAFAAACRERS